MEEFNQIPNAPALNRPESRESGIDRFFNGHLATTEFNKRKRDSDLAFSSFIQMVSHIHKWNLTEAEMNSSLAELARQQAEFHLDCARRLKGCNGQLTELKRVKQCLNEGGLTAEDINMTVEEINKLEKL
ncbi:MAG: hypothetical protein Q8P32_02045 [Candidatus Komeilibacteria bacterium]|nr:hypothetical protein [Candidatus Komeilibacteria bacterium]